MKQKLVIIVTVILSAVVLCSCIPLFMKKGVKGAKVWVNEEENRTMIIIPMIHEQSAEFYEEIRLYLDSLKAKGFVVFYETVDYKDREDTETNELLALKFRRLSGVQYYGSNNHSALSRKVKKGKYVLQTNERLGLTTDKDIWADMYMDDLIASIEFDYGEIELTDYDYNTPLGDKYKVKSRSLYIIGHKYRDKHLMEMLMNSQYPDIVVVYGAAHYNSMLIAVPQRLGFTEVSKRDLRKERKANK